MAFEVPPLPYDYNALEPHIDEETMHLHHDKHHQAYVTNANAALEGTEWADKSVEEVTTGKSTDTTNIKKYAQVLGKLHKAGLVYGDTKPQNALVGKNGIDLLDLEQAVERGDKAWDLAEFLYYSAKLAKQEEGMKLVADSFLEAYRSENGDGVIAKARNIRYLTPFMLVLAPKMRRVVREALAKIPSSDGPPP